MLTTFLLPKYLQVVAEIDGTSRRLNPDGSTFLVYFKDRDYPALLFTLTMDRASFTTLCGEKTFRMKGLLAFCVDR